MTDKTKIEILKTRIGQLEAENEQLKKQLADLPHVRDYMTVLTAAKSQYEQLTKETLEIKDRYQVILDELSLLKQTYKRKFLKELKVIKQSKRR